MRDYYALAGIFYSTRTLSGQGHKGDLGPGGYVDADRLQQVAWNLLSNAIKFTPTGGHVSVRLESTADEVRLVVSDTGVGFAPDVAVHLFERFRQGDGSSTHTMTSHRFSLRSSASPGSAPRRRVGPAGIELRSAGSQVANPPDAFGDP